MSQHEEQPMKKKTTHKRRPVDPVKAKHRKINSILMMVLLGACVVTILALIINTVRVVRASSVANQGTEEGMTANTGQSMKNDVYIIGNNPTDIEKEYFQKLTDAGEAAVTVKVSDGCPERGNSGRNRGSGRIQLRF